MKSLLDVIEPPASDIEFVSKPASELPVLLAQTLQPSREARAIAVKCLCQESLDLEVVGRRGQRSNVTWQDETKIKELD